MGSWEDELDVDLSDIWAAASSKPVQGRTQEQQPAGIGVSAVEVDNRDLGLGEIRVSAVGVDNRGLGSREIRVSAVEVDNRDLGIGDEVTRLQSENGSTVPLRTADVADAPLRIASLPSEPSGSRGGTTVPIATERLPSKRLLPLPSFQPVVLREGSCIPSVPTQNLASRGDEFKQQREPGIPGSRASNPNPRQKAAQQPPVDIRNYFTHSGASSGSGAARKKPRIAGPVGELYRKAQPGEAGDVADGAAEIGFRSAEDEFNERVFRKGAWISALQSLNVGEFDPARYAVLKVTASAIRSLRAPQIPHFVAVIKEVTPTVFGDAAVILKDPTGTVAGMVNNKVFSNTEYARAISPGAAIILKQVAVFRPSAHYLNITISNVVQVFPANTDLPQASAPQQQQEPVPHKPESHLWSQAQAQPEQDRPAEAQPPPPSQQQGPQTRSSWDLLSPSPPSPSSPREPQAAPEGIAEAAKIAGWGDMIDDMEALLNEGVDNFYA